MKTIQNLPKLLALRDSLDRQDNFASQRQAFREVLDDADNNWHRFVINPWHDGDGNVLKTILQNFGLNASVVGFPRQQAEELGCNVPWTILLEPTNACNLECTGCWTAEYGNKLNLSYAEMDSIVIQAKALGARFFLFSGVEPLGAKKGHHPPVRGTRRLRLRRLHQRHPHRRGFCRRDAARQNFVPAISVEASRMGDAICTSTQTATWSPAPSSTIQTQASGKRRC